MTAYSQPGVFNVLDYGFTTSTGGGLAIANAQILQNVINLAQASGNPSGAVVLVPSYSVDSTGAAQYGPFPIDTSTSMQGPITISGSAPLLICGTGEGTTLLMQSSMGSAEMFSITGTGAVTFQDLTIKYDFGFSLHGTAINFTSAAAHKVFRLNFEDCQYPVAFNGTKGARVLQCYFNYATSISGQDLIAVQIIGGSSDTSISQCLLRSGLTAKSGFYGLYVDQATNLKLSDSQIQDFGTGLLLQGTNGSTTGVSVVGCRFSTAGQCLQINPTVVEVSFTDCHFQASGSYVGDGPGIGVGNVGTVNNSEIDTIRFISCSLTGNTTAVGYGLQIGAGQNIQICGGDYSGNGAAANIAGIAVVGGASNVQIIGANCTGVESEGGHDSPPFFQQYGILISWGSDIQIIGAICSANGLPGTSNPGDGIHIDGTNKSVTGLTIIGVSATGSLGQSIDQNAGVTITSASEIVVAGCILNGVYAYGLYLNNVADVIVKDCDLNGNTTGLYIDTGSTRVYARDCNASGYSSIGNAIFVYNSLTAVEITNCAGYNDAHTVFPVSTPPSGTFSSVTVANYYGPTTFYSTEAFVTIDTHATQLSSGVFTLSPLENALLAGFGHTPFLMIGN